MTSLMWQSGKVVSPFDPESVAIQAGKMKLLRIDVYRRYENGLKNLVDIFIPIVDSWLIVDNGVEPRDVVAKGTKQETYILCEDKFNLINCHHGREQNFR